MNANAIPLNANGAFSGYASVFGHVDQGGDIVLPGAFSKSLARKGEAQIRMLFQHDPKEPIGVWERVIEDGFGLWVEGRLLAGVPRADALRRLIEQRAIDGLSIGFKAVRARREPGSGHRHLIQIDLWEISIVTFPMMDGARILPVTNNPAEARRLRRSLDAAVSRLRNQ